MEVPLHSRRSTADHRLLPEDRGTQESALFDRLDQMDLSSHASAMGTYRRLLVEMVTQRLTFDYQLVDAENNQTTTNDLFYTLLGHRVHRIACNYPYDQVHITEYTANEAEASKTEKYTSCTATCPGSAPQ